MWELDHKNGWALKNCCLHIMVLEKTLEISLDCQEIKPVSPKGNQPWIFIRKTDPEAEAPILWSLGVKSWLIGKDTAVGKDWRQGRKQYQNIRWLDGITSSKDINLGKLWEMVKNKKVRCAAVRGVTMSQTQLNDWTTTKITYILESKK